MPSAAVTVRTVDGKAEAVITVVQQAPIEPTSLEIEVPQNRLVKGQTLTLIVKVEPEDAYLPPLVWSSSNSAVVSVDQQGVVTAVEVGEATVTGTYGKLRCDVAFEVRAAPTALPTWPHCPVRALRAARESIPSRPA